MVPRVYVNHIIMAPVAQSMNVVVHARMVMASVWTVHVSVPLHTRGIYVKHPLAVPLLVHSH